MSSVYADVIVDITNEKLDRTFQYKVPPELTGRSVRERRYRFRLETETARSPAMCFPSETSRNIRRTG